MGAGAFLEEDSDFVLDVLADAAVLPLDELHVQRVLFAAENVFIGWVDRLLL